MIVVQTKSDELLGDLASAARSPSSTRCRRATTLRGVGQPLHASRAVRRPLPPQACIRRRRQQRSPFAAGSRRCGWNGDPARLPASHGPSDDIGTSARKIAATAGGSISVLECPREAVAGVVYTDVWVSMGEKAAVDTRRDFDGPCLPARRGLEVTADSLDGPRSLVWRHVANQIPVTQALAHSLLAQRPSGHPAADTLRRD
jgi:hypothetical protein